MTAHAGVPMLQRFSPYAVDGGCDAYGQMEEDEFGDYYNREDADAAMSAAQAEITNLRKALDRKTDAAETWRDKYSHVVGLHKPRADGTPPSDEEIASAIRSTEYKYFGDYEMSDEQRDAIEVLINAAQQFSAARATEATL
jgi:hypothetical protein